MSELYIEISALLALCDRPAQSAIKKWQSTDSEIPRCLLLCISVKQADTLWTAGRADILLTVERPQTKNIVSPPIPLWKLALITVGPGLVVMLADTDAGSAIVAAQSAARWGYRLLLLQLLLVPILYFVQELTVRLGLVTRKGHGELIAEHFGKRWA